MQEPFCSVPLIWIIQEDTLANRLSMYEEMGWMHLISHWRSAFSRANVIVFPDYSLPVDLLSFLNVTLLIVPVVICIFPSNFNCFLQFVSDAL